ncbi:DNA ligase D [Filobacillus milosensis]|nr:DNA ligase D [Filobacillus milosensis]
MWKPMLPTLVTEAPTQKKWVYEVKYDGFRCGLEWTNNVIKLWSRNGNDLTSSFPEIVDWCKQHEKYISHYLPLFLDGEITILRTEFQAIFPLIQQRGRLKSKEKINKTSQTRPACFLAFDLLKSDNQSLAQISYKERRAKLEGIFYQLEINTLNIFRPVNIVQQFKSINEISKVVNLHQSEGIVAKQTTSKYVEGKRTNEWVKVKNYRIIPGIITGWDANNKYFKLSYYKEDELLTLGKVKNGFPTHEKNTLSTFIQENGEKFNRTTWSVPPSACIDINCLDAHEAELREPSFHHFRFDLEPDHCTNIIIQEGLAQLPPEIEISKADKLLFPNINKRQYVLYLREVAPFLLPKLNNKRLTMIRYPDGINEHFFYQKHLPDYAPDFIETISGEDGDEDILCNDLRSLLWFGNHAALEFHVPFHTIHSEYPDEMVFDLDPPSHHEFHLAIKAAQLIKEMVEHQGYRPFVKTSGKTGLQIHIPLQPESMTFDQTREFMEAVAHVLVDQYSDDFTIERLKKNRGKRLYIDYVQHAKGKTIVAPYSPRATEGATVATPLFWDEVNENLNPANFTINNVTQRIKQLGCPFSAMSDL